MVEMGILHLFRLLRLLLISRFWIASFNPERILKSPCVKRINLQIPSITIVCFWLSHRIDFYPLNKYRCNNSFCSGGNSLNKKSQRIVFEADSDKSTFGVSVN